MKFRLFKSSEMGEALWSAFAALRNASPIYDDPFFDPDFALLVSEVRADTRIAVAFEQDEPVGFWPLHERPGHWARPIGGPFSDWHGPVLKAGSQLTPAAFLSGLGLAGMTVFGLLPQSATKTSGLSRDGASMTDLSMGWERFIANQEACWPKHFKKMRRLYRNVERDYSEFQFAWDNRDDVAFDRLIELKRDQFARTGFHDVLKSEWACGLLDRLRHFEGARLRSRLVTLHYGGQHAASELNLQSDTVLHGWLTGFEQEMASYSPGNMLVQEALRYMPDEKLLTYDAGPGLYHYKRHYANYQKPLEAGVVRGARGKISPVRIAGRAWRASEKLLPGKPGEILGRARRRMDQIAIAETGTGARVSGFLNAITKRPI